MTKISRTDRIGFGWLRVLIKVRKLNLEQICQNFVDINLFAGPKAAHKNFFLSNDPVEISSVNICRQSVSKNICFVKSHY